jgi:cytochrome c5
VTGPRRRTLAVLAALGAAALLAHAAAGEDFEFMPKGGRVLLLEAVGTSAAALGPVTQQQRTEPQWREFADAQKKPLTERERATLAAYLAVNMPLPSPAQAATQLPRDGRDLAWEQCQSCHSLFAGYLTQSRAVVGWRNVFMSPFHRELKMTPREREEFARYSEINMPMKVEDVPPDLRF